MKTTAIRTDQIAKLGHAEAMELARDARDKLDAELVALSPSDWDQPTDCSRWTVKDVVAHLISMGEDLITLPKLFAAQRAGYKACKDMGIEKKFDRWTEHQVIRQRHLDPQQTLAKFRTTSEDLLQRRANAGALLRQIRMPQPPYGIWTFGYMMDEILTRDVWMHRADIAKATGKPMILDERDVRFVATIVRELAARWKQPFTLELTGPAGGTYVHSPIGSDRAEFTMDAIDCMRVLSGRGDASIPFYAKVPF